MSDKTQSHELSRQARQYMPGGVSSPVRAGSSVGGTPVIIEEARGSRMYDADGTAYIDYVCSWGPLILGHAHPQVVAAICQAAELGTSFGATCDLEIELARLICEAVPSIEKVRLVNSGTEAAMSAVRLARAYTGRDKIIKFEGCYHGHADAFLIKAGSGLLTSGVATTRGVPAAVAADTLVAHYNDLDSVAELFQAHGPEIAAVIVETVAGNMGLVLPAPGFLQGLREITAGHGSLLIFDEVITGFRLRYGCYQDSAGVRPDLTLLGKIIGGGLPVGAYGGRGDIMALVAPEGDVYQAGTLSGNPLAMAAGGATLEILRSAETYARLEELGALLEEEIRQVFKRHGLGCALNRLGSLFTIFFTDREVSSYRDVMSCDLARFAAFYQRLLEQEIYFPPSQFETCFISAAHDADDIARTVGAIDKALAKG
jgi:glutamate-1-semialdehyde 2,1-aminomutase